MTIAELREVNAMSFKGFSIMDASTSRLKEICMQALNRIDDYQQQAGEKGIAVLEGYLSVTYSEVEKAYRHLNEGGLISMSSRNELRFLLKEVEKSIVLL